MKHWYTLFTKPRKEYMVEEILESKGIEAYVPSIVVTRRGRQVKQAFFPRYMFVHVDFDTVGVSEIQWTPGLTRIISFGGRLARVPAEVIELMRERLSDFDERDYIPLRPGDRIRILDGPFRDFEGVFAQHLSSKQRVAILVDILGRATRCEIELSQIERV